MSSRPTAARPGRPAAGRGARRRRARALATSLLVLAAAACEPPAQPAPIAGAVVAPQSRERETCAATADCEPPLRCVEHACTSPVTSRLGEYYWAVGEAAEARGDREAAFTAYGDALTRFEKEKVPPPPGLFCSYGAALRRKPGDAKAAEQAARLLHRCLLATAPGSRDHGRALRELAELDAAGLDPDRLAQDQTTDTYLTKPPRKLAAESLRIQVLASAAAKDKGYVGWVKTLESDAVRRLLVPCLDEYYAATGKAQLQVPLAVKFKARWNEDEELYMGGALELEPSPGGGAAESKAAECARAALAPVAEEFARRSTSGSWAGGVTLSLAAGSP